MKSQNYRSLTLYIIALLGLFMPLHGMAQEADSLREESLDEIEIVDRKPGIMSVGDAIGGQIIGRGELFRAACCNLGESFTTNPSVDVNYTDAATGAKQIRLLGLSGAYVQMLVENMPTFRGAGLPFALDFVPGQWMQSIQVSKGAASVKNGMDAITGQINIEYLKPDAENGITLNGYANTEGNIDTNIDANVNISKRWSTIVLGHFNNANMEKDGNHDGFQDMPWRRQFNVQNRWIYRGEKYIGHYGAGLLRDFRHSGQLNTQYSPTIDNYMRYRIDMVTTRFDAYMKHAWILNKKHNTNIAWMVNYSFQTMEASFGHLLGYYQPGDHTYDNISYRSYNPDHHDANSQLMFETDINEHHNISIGLSERVDYLDESLSIPGLEEKTNRYDWNYMPIPACNGSKLLYIGGYYAQYTYTLGTRFTAMAGLRYDTDFTERFYTPRFHLKYTPADWVTLRLSAGRGIRYYHTIAENFNLLASGRDVTIDTEQDFEDAWNYGITAQFNTLIGGRQLKINVEYYYTYFRHQLIADMETAGELAFYLAGRGGRSHTVQVDATYSPFRGMEITAAWRYNNVKQMIDGHLKERPLQSRYKGLLTASYSTPMRLWQFDITCQLNGPGRLPASADTTMPSEFKAYPWLSAQVTRQFRRIALYVGGENLTGYKQKHPIAGYDNPYSQQFDATMIYGPLRGAMAYIGFRINIGRMPSL